MNKLNFLDIFYYQWWKSIDKLIFFLILSLIILGIVFSLASTSLIASAKLETTSYHFFFKHLFYTLLGIVVIFILSLLDEKNLYRVSVAIFLILFLALILVPLYGVETKGSKRWLDPVILPRFQPVEMIKPFLIVVLSMIFSSNKLSKLHSRYILSILIILPVLLLLIIQPDFGQTLLIFSTWLSLIFVTGINIFFLISFLILTSSIFTSLIIFNSKFSYIKQRILNFINNSSEGNYQSEKASEAIINGGFFGKGIGEGKLNIRVPEAHTDYVIAVISEEFGVITILGILLIFIIIIFQVLKKVSIEKNICSKLIMTGCILMILYQVLIHIGVNIRLLPTTGMTLPFLSYGGSSIIGTSVIFGIILNLTKRKIN